MIPSRRREPRPEIEQPSASELAQRIRKLRWMGMEDEARRLQAELSSSRRATASSPHPATPINNQRKLSGVSTAAADISP
jgi:hypothetical protein